MRKQLTPLLRLFTTGVCLSAALQNLDAATQVGAFTGGDPDEGLDLQGTFIYAVNIGTLGEVGQAGDAYFTADDVEGVSVTAQNQIPNWHLPQYGDTPDDDVLETVMTDIRWSAAPAKPLIVLTGLVPNATYKLQLLFAEQCCANRGFDVVVNGALAVDEFNPAGIQGGAGNQFQAAVVTHEFLSITDTLTIELDGVGISTPAYTDHNPIINGFTLEQTEAPGDTDNDGLPDSWENTYFGNLNQTSGGDPDGDTLTNAEELLGTSDPTKPDTDGDGLNDAAEIETHGTNPNRPDTDSDTLSDHAEVTTHNTNPLDADSDDDMVNDPAEVLRYLTNPNQADTDGDGDSDYVEIHLLTNPLDAASKTTRTTANLFTGPDPGLGLDFEGVFPYAISFGNAQPGGQVYDALFTADDVEGFSVVASQVQNNWNVGVNYGDSAEAQVLSSVMASIRWSNSDHATTPQVTLTFSNLEVGGHYKLQLLFAEFLWARGFNISANNRPIAREFAPYQWQGGFTVTTPQGLATARDSGVVLNHSFVANNTDLIIVLDGRPVTDPTMADHNAIINGSTLELLEGASDTDSDGLFDAWERDMFGDLDETGAGDTDSDGLNNADEFGLATDPNDSDSDNDGLTDGNEVNSALTDPSNPDSDGDGLTDGDEVNSVESDPLNPDTDGDLLNDGVEVNVHQTDPVDSDTDGDGKNDWAEVNFGSDPLVAEPVTVVSNVIVQPFSGGDEGEGLDLQGNFLYAFNVSSAGAAGQAGDANFTADNAAGITLTAPNNIPAWDMPNYGDSPADDVIEKVMQSIRYGPVMRLELANVSPGGTYKLQLLFYEQCCANRGFNIYADGELIAADFSPPLIQGGVNLQTSGAVVSAELTTQKDKLVVILTTTGRTDPTLTDPNAILDGATLEVLSVIARPTVTVTPAANGQITIATTGTALQEADNVEGPYTTLAQASITLDPKAGGVKKFYRGVQ